MKSWKTTSAGILMVTSGIVGFYFAAKSGNINEGTVTACIGSILGGIGLIFAKDGNVTGGTTQQ